MKISSKLSIGELHSNNCEYLPVNQPTGSNEIFIELLDACELAQKNCFCIKTLRANLRKHLEKQV